ncbi:YARHG domain-containing protein [Flavobacterium suzhouense]|uniref:YARHG domain-containing protein n=1 Tax=Flavobacterium suzhouense TaxID=1529638 RepID=A0ABW5NV33_9FLAO
MKHLLLAVCLLSLIVSCKREVFQSEDVMDKSLLAYAEIPKESHRELYGLWTGIAKPDYNLDEVDNVEDTPSKLTIKITRIIKDSVFGQSISKGSRSSFKGILSNKNGLLFFTLNETGKNKQDGKFELSINNDTLQGKWAIYKPNDETNPRKKLKLVQKDFIYDPKVMLEEDYNTFIDWDNPVVKDFSYTTEEGKEIPYKRETYRISSEDVFKINASTDVLTEESLKNFKKVDLEIIKNSIYARHGYAFKKKAFRDFFESNEWYVPLSDNVDKELTKLEKKNIALLKRMEEYATDHYQTFGR